MRSRYRNGRDHVAITIAPEKSPLLSGSSDSPLGGADEVKASEASSDEASSDEASSDKVESLSALDVLPEALLMEEVLGFLSLTEVYSIMPGLSKAWHERFDSFDKRAMFLALLPKWESRRDLFYLCLHSYMLLNEEGAGYEGSNSDVEFFARQLKKSVRDEIRSEHPDIARVSYDHHHETHLMGEGIWNCFCFVFCCCLPFYLLPLLPSQDDDTGVDEIVTCAMFGLGAGLLWSGIVASCIFRHERLYAPYDELPQYIKSDIDKLFTYVLPQASTVNNAHEVAQGLHSNRTVNYLIQDGQLKQQVDYQLNKPQYRCCFWKLPHRLTTSRPILRDVYELLDSDLKNGEGGSDAARAAP